MRLLRAGLEPLTSFNSNPGTIDGTWMTDSIKCAAKSKILLGFFVDKGSAATLTARIYSRILNDPIQDPPDGKHGDAAYDKWHEVYAVSGGVGAVDDVAITLAADVYFTLPISVEHHSEIAVAVKVDNVTGCLVSAYELGNYVQKIQYGNIQSG